MANDFIDGISEELNLSDIERRILNAIDVRSYEELHSLVQSFPSLARMGVALPKLSNAAFLAADRGFVRFAAEIEQAQPAVSFGALPPPEAPVTLNAIVGLPPEPLPSQAEAVAVTAGAPGAVGAPAAAGALDFRLPHWPVRNQQQRGTCVAFGTAACVEHMRGDGTDLSEQFLYWAIKTHTADPYPGSDGTWLEFSRVALASHGICLEAEWPYVGTPVSPVSGAAPGQPGSGASVSAATRRHHAAFHQRNPRSAASVALNLMRTNQRPLAISLPVFADPLTPSNATNWTTAVGWDYGTVINPPPTSRVSGGHCVCITGFVPDADEPSGGYFVIRNSWDRSWGRNNGSGSRAPEPGYGTVSATYVNTYTWELFQL